MIKTDKEYALLQEPLLDTIKKEMEWFYFVNRENKTIKSKNNWCCCWYWY